MSTVEEILQRIKSQPGVERCVISTAEGQVLRQFPNMPQEKAGAFAMSTKDLTNKARGVVRDLNPKEELQYLRIRVKHHEVMVAYQHDFLVIIIQRWQPYAAT